MQSGLALYTSRYERAYISTEDKYVVAARIGSSVLPSARAHVLDSATWKVWIKRVDRLAAERICRSPRSSAATEASALRSCEAR